MPEKNFKDSLFDDCPDSSEEDDDVTQKRSPLHVNEEYARRFEHNSRRAELHRLQEKHPELAARLQEREIEARDDDGTESSSSEEEDEGELSPETEQEWAQALLKIKRKDPSIYNSHTRLFQDSSESEEPASEEEAQHITEASERKKSKKKVLRQVLYDQAVAEGGDEEEPMDTDFELKKRLRFDDGTTNGTLAYDHEQRALRDAFVAKGLASDADGSDDGEGSGDDERGGLQVRMRAKKASGGAGVEALGAAEKDLDAYFASEDRSQDAGAAFLKHFLQQRLWAQDGDDAGDSTGAFLGTGNDDLDDGAREMPVDVDHEDDEFLDQADRFEKAYNFRSEEENGGQIATFPRRIEGLARQEDSKRKRQREAKRIREQEREQQRKEEVKRLKNLKKREVEVSGKGAPDRSLLQKLLDSDFDPAAWDKHMSAAFDEEYYAEAEREEEVTAPAPEVMKEVGAWVADGGDAGEEGTFAQVHKKVTGKDAGGLLPETDYAQPNPAPGSNADEDLMASDEEESGSEDDGDVLDGDQVAEGNADGDEADAPDENKAASRHRVHDLLRDYYKLDHEDEVGGVKTRFRYRTVAPIRDGLSTEEILSLPDRDLNSIIGLRKLAPYREDVTVVRPNYKALEEARQKLVDEGLFIDKSNAKLKGRKVGKGKWKAAGGSISPGRTQSSGVHKRGAKTSRAAGNDKHTAQKLTKKKQQVEGDADGKRARKAAGKKRPGPALRRAMKEASAVKKDTEDNSVEKDADKPDDSRMQNSQTTQAHEKYAMAHTDSRPKGSSMGRKTLHTMTDAEKVKARAASYAGIALPAASVKNSSSKQHKQSAHKSQPEIENSNKVQDHGVVSDLPKAARKNLKRKQKRENAWAGREAQA